jgi:hypothetical protein
MLTNVAAMAVMLKVLYCIVLYWNRAAVRSQSAAECSSQQNAAATVPSLSLGAVRMMMMLQMIPIGGRERVLGNDQSINQAGVRELGV